MGKTGKSARVSTVRVIAGKLKGRRIRVVPDGIRPTADRVRETLFNWLAPYVRGAHSLDMFAGSGALGIESLSRGAASATFVERDQSVAAELRATLDEFSCPGRVHNADALRLNYNALGPFNIVFMDPPFNGPSITNLCTLLEDSGGLADEALIYIEMSRKGAPPELPLNWKLIKQATAGQVWFALAERTVTPDT